MKIPNSSSNAISNKINPARDKDYEDWLLGSYWRWAKYHP